MIGFQELNWKSGGRAQNANGTSPRVSRGTQLFYFEAPDRV
jgi:hypothetical protein